MYNYDARSYVDDNNQINIIQTYHRISFYAYDIMNIQPFNKSMVTAYFIPECEKRDTLRGECKVQDKNICLHCDYEFKLEEMYVDGFYVEKNDYIVTLQTGIRVPISIHFYPKIKTMWEEYKTRSKKSF